MAVRRIIPYHRARDIEATRAFYTGVLQIEEGSFGGGYIGFGSGTAQVVFAPPGVADELPDMGIDVGSGRPLMLRTPRRGNVDMRSSTARSTNRGGSAGSSSAIRTAS
jgi:catechol 2,3-dioxygenase-like lactoylglutathione lyase family enzyme